MSASQLTLEEVLHISQVQQLKEQLIKAIESGNGILVDAQAVERADTASVQLLLAAKLSCDKQELTFNLENVSEALNTAICSLGLAEAFEI